VLSDESRLAVCDDVCRVNLSKYVGEAVAAIADARLKAGDIHAAVHVCSLLHARYDKFVAQLLPAVQVSFGPPPVPPTGFNYPKQWFGVI
jgi:regulator of nonsense transcripts 2